MDSQPFDQTRDALLAFASEGSVVAPTADREPAFLRTPTPHDGHLSITSVASEGPPAQTANGRSVTTVLVIAGVVAGFIGGYVFADRIIAPTAAPAARVTTPAPPAVPDPVPAAAPIPAPLAASESSAPAAEPSTALPREPSVLQTAQATDGKVAPVATAPATTKRASTPPPTRRSAAARPRPVAPAATLHSGAIEIVSRPRDARVLLDGNVVGLAPLSIPDVPEGLHEVRVELDGFSPWVGSVRVKGGSRARVGASLRP